MFKIIRHEPAVIAGAIAAIIALAIAFGVHLSADQTGAIMAVVSAVGALLVRSQVTPVVPVAPVVAPVLPPT
ncbi:MAG: hypothetical protein NVSMB4_00440 [Acidimicrobiales bacterium]